MIIDSTAIVLKRFLYGDTSIIARCFVKEIGKVSFMVHGAHRAKSSKAAYFQPANCIDFILKKTGIFKLYLRPHFLNLGVKSQMI